MLVHYHVTAAGVRDFGDPSSDEESQPPRRYTNYYYKLLMPARAAGQTDLAPISHACARLRIPIGRTKTLPLLECILAAGAE